MQVGRLGTWPVSRIRYFGLPAFLLATVPVQRISYKQVLLSSGSYVIVDVGTFLDRVQSAISYQSKGVQD